MGCGCTGEKAGFVSVWQLRHSGTTHEFPDQASAYAKQKELGGGGVILKATKRKSAA